MTGKLIALVTGANKGLGKETARSLAEQGHTVLIGCRNLELGQQAVKELTSIGSPVEAICLDVTDLRSIQDAAALVKDKFGVLDILINNAGVANPEKLEFEALPKATEQTARQFRAVYETNVFGVVEVIRAFVPLLEQSTWGRIVNVSSGVGSFTSPGHGMQAGKSPLYMPYQTSKAALNAMTLLYARHFAQSGSHIKINAVCPGFCATDLNGHRGTKSAQQGGQIAVKMALIGADGPSGGFFDDDGAVAW